MKGATTMSVGVQAAAAEFRRDCPGGGVSRGLLVALASVAIAAAVSYYYQYVAGRSALAADVAPVTPGGDARVERGRYLVTVGGCTDCHTPFKMTDKGPQPDMDRYLSGHPEQM